MSYDANGNILTYLRNGATGVNGLAMDSLTYQYARNNAGQLINNRLRYVHDRVADNAYTEDIDSQTPLTLSQVQAEKLDAQTTDNYQYDEIGNLIKDTKEGITAIEWNVYGKIKSITKGSMTITYTYDAAGNRISKEVDPASGPTRKTYYVRDATGNVMSVYEEGGLVNDGNLTQAEVHLYGSSRLGIFKPDVDMTSLVATDVYGFERGKKFFELSNHLGNVLVSITDRKNGVCLSTDTALVDYYLPDIASANDYYPFGMTMPGRSVHGDKYRYGFNGKENDGETGLQDYGFRIYNPGLGKFLSVDPLTADYPWYTPYQFAGNMPIEAIDVDGLEEYYVNLLSNMRHKTELHKRADDEVMRYRMHMRQDIAVFNPFTGKNVIGPRSEVNAIVNVSRINYNQDLGDAVRGGFFGSVGYLAAGDEGAFKMAPIDNSLAALAALGGAKSLTPVPEPPSAKRTTNNTNRRVTAANNGNTAAAIENTNSAKKLQVGPYKEMAKTNAKTNLSADHIPSFAAIKRHVETIQGVKLDEPAINALRKSTLTLVYETQIHQTVSRTYGGRNNRAQIALDAVDLVGAIKRDIQALTPNLLKAGYSQSDINSAQQQLTEKYVKPKK